MVLFKKGLSKKMFSCVLSVLAVGAFALSVTPDTSAKGSRGGRGGHGHHSVHGHFRHSGGKVTHVKAHTAKNPKTHDVKAHTRHTKNGKIVHVKAHHKSVRGSSSPTTESPSVKSDTVSLAAFDKINTVGSDSLAEFDKINF